MGVGKRWRMAMVASGAAVALAAVTAPAVAGGATATRGDFSTLLAAVGQHEEGLVGRAHLHDAPCSASNPGGGHYKHDPAGVGQPPNQLWPSSTSHDALAGITANAGGNASGRGTADWVAGGSAVSVVVHAGVGHGATSTAGGPKLACTDLG